MTMWEQDTWRDTPQYQTQENAEYWIDHYMERIAFARKRLQRQLQTAQERQKDAKMELIIAGSLLIAVYLGWFFLQALMRTTVLGYLIASIIYAFYKLVLLIGYPICIYKVIKSAVVMLIDGRGMVGLWLIKAFRLEVYADEIDSCQEYLRSYNAVYQDMVEWKEDLAQARSVDLTIVAQRFERLDLDPQIKVISPMQGRISKVAAFVALVLDIMLVHWIWFPT